MARLRDAVYEEAVEHANEEHRRLQEAYANGDLEAHVDFPDELTTDQRYAIMVVAKLLAESIQARMDQTLGRID